MNTVQVRVLLVDDDEDDFVVVRDLFSEFEDARLKLSWRPTFTEAREALLGGAFEVCLLDLRLGKENGLDLLRLASNSGCRVPIIVLTGLGDRTLEREALEIGATDYLVKGQMSSEMLERAIRYALHRQLAIETLREREENFRSLLDAVSEGLFVHDLRGQIVDLNRAGAAIFGHQAVELQGKNIFAYCGDEYRSNFLFEDATFPVTLLETKGIRSDGTPVWLEVSGKTYLYKGKDYYLTAIRDLTVRKDLEAKLLTALTRQPESLQKPQIESYDLVFGFQMLQANLRKLEELCLSPSMLRFHHLSMVHRYLS